MVKKTKLLAALCVSAIAAAGCGSSGGTSSSGDASSKAPITIEGIFDLTGTNGLEATDPNDLRAGVAGVNARGGINGRKLQVEICDSQLSANGSAACGRQAVADHAVAVIDFAEAAAFDAYLIPAHIADFNALIDPLTFKAANSFSIFAGELAATTGLATIGKSANCKNIAQITEYAPPAVRVAAENSFSQAAEAAGMTVARPIYPIQGTLDMSPIAQDAVSEGIDCAVVIGAGADEVSLIKALNSADPKLTIITGVSQLNGNEAALGSLMSKLVIQGLSYTSTDTSNSAVRQWVSDIKKYGPKPVGLDSNSAVLWASVQLVAYAARHVSDPTAANVEQFLAHLTSYNPGVVPPVSFTKPYPTQLGTRIFAVGQIPFVYKNNAYYAMPPFRNVFTGAALQG